MFWKSNYLFQILKQENFLFNLCICTWLQTLTEDFHMNGASAGYPVQMESPVELKSSRSLAWFFPQSEHLLVTSPLPSDYFSEVCWFNIMCETSVPLWVWLKLEFPGETDSYSDRQSVCTSLISLRHHVRKETAEMGIQCPVPEGGKVGGTVHWLCH